ncbi:radical SAM/SPASM domain-containing protein [Nitrospirillum sp. BR 11828]|uniref:radical SAM/SPASM domain-containing protein n=1 Tax=Nitrospirillum sp. BR 11828 TaxID=3104325 RepID=UPI002ACA7A3F|nr:radical SAM protein [Nitrospirillum sp. BR 11828]MDZ5649761.1 SPASM domain-containing protein [Nitrospirillum sp. BR 11828]
MPELPKWPSNHSELNRLRQRLTTVHFDVVGGCQLRCVGCPNSGLDPRPEFIAPELFQRCLANIDVQKITLLRLFNYGEPLLHPRLAELGRILLDSPIRIHWTEISTNAQCNAEDRLEALVAMGAINLLTISCDGDGTPAQYEALRPPAKWSKLMSFLSFARDLAARYPRLRLQARCVIDSPEDEGRWREVLKPYGVHPEFRGWIQLPDSLRDRSRDTVPMGQGVCAMVADPGNLYVDHRGNIVPCCFHPGAGLLGNLGESRYSALFAGPKRADFLESLALRRAEMRVCSRCDVGADPALSPSTEAVARFQRGGL